MLNSMTIEQLGEWHSYYLLEPFGEERDDLRSGIIASTIANVNRDSKRRSRPYQPSDFMPDYEKQATRKPLTSVEEWEEVKAMARALRAS